MFKKKPNIKTLSPLRSSDRRKIADRIIADYGIQFDDRNSEDTAQDQPNSHSAVRRSLLPDNALTAKFTTTTGPQLTEVNGTVYVGVHEPGDQRVLWVRVNDTLYPTVYTLWRNPRILPVLHTPSLVIGKLKGGADLMTPGLAGPPFPKTAKKGAVVAVASLDSPTVPVVVGTCVIDVCDLQTTRGVKGHAVETFHWAGDDLWDWSTSGRPGTTPPNELSVGPPAEDGHLAELTEQIALDKSNEDEDGGDDGDGDGGVSLHGTPEKQQGDSSAHNRHVEGEDAIAEVVDALSQESQLTTPEIDDAFLNAFLYGVHHQKEIVRGDSKYGLKFPLAQSFVMSNLVLPFLPTFTPEQAAALQIKKTSWKNTRKFLIALGNKKLVLIKEAKNEAVVRDIDFDDPLIKDFEPYRLPKKEPSVNASTTAANKSTAGNDDLSIGQQLKIQNLYKPRDSLSDIFTGAKPYKSQFYTATDVRAIVTKYIETNQLLSPSNRRLIQLDPLISNTVLSTANAADKEILAKGTITRDALIERIMSLCNAFHLILRNDETPDSTNAKPAPGAAPRIGIIMETRGGNKTATRVHGLESYFISPQPLADELRKSCAGSTSVEPFKGGKGMEVMVQGPQKDAVIKALEKRGVSKQWVEVVDKTKGKKK